MAMIDVPPAYVVERLPKPAPVVESYHSLIKKKLGIKTNPIGKGSYSKVYDYFYNGQNCVVKIAVSEEACKMLEKENEMYKTLSNTDFFPKIENYEKGYLIMEKLGKILFELIQDKIGDSHKKVYFKEMVQAVKICHKNRICHHDIKNNNFMTSINPPNQIKLLDFGLSHTFGIEMVQPSEEVKEELEHLIIPPEMLDNFKCAGHHDIFMLGICLFELEAGYPPFENTYYCEYWKAFIKFIKENKDRFWRWNVEKENFKPSEDFKELLAGMLNPDLEKRFTIDDVINSKYYKSCLEAVGASAASPFKSHKKRKSNKRVRGQRTSRRKAKRGSARARRVKTALNSPLKKGRTPKARFHRGVPPPHGGI